MNASTTSRWLAVSTLFALTACGGGGGGGNPPPPPAPTPPVVTPTPVTPTPPSPAPTPTPAPPPAPTPAPAPTPTPAPAPTTMSFDVAQATIGVASGSVGSSTVHVTTSAPLSGQLYAAVREDAAVLASAFEVSSADPANVSFTLHTLPTLALGHHTGTLQVLLCADAACAQTVVAATPLPYDIDVEPSALKAAPQSTTAAVAHRGASPLDPVTVAVTGAGLHWSTATPASWLQVDGTAHDGDGTISVRFASAALAEGHYADNVVVSSADGQSVALPFSVDILPAAFAVGGDTLAFDAVAGAPIPPQTLSFMLDGAASSSWTATHDASWMDITAGGSTLPASIMLTPHATLAPGSYVDHIVLHAPGVADKPVTAQLVLHPAVLSGSATSVSLGGDRGRDPTVAARLTLGLDTGTAAWPVAATNVPPWLAGVPASSTVSQTGRPLTLTPQGASLPVGSTSQVVHFTATVNGATSDLPVTVNLDADQRRLLPSTWGVGLASSPNGTVLSRTVTMGVNFGADVAWSASANRPWLSVTPSGSTDGAPTLSLTADPATLADGSYDVADVTVSTTQAGVAPATLRVGLWKGSTGLSGVTVRPMPRAVWPVTAADRVRPLVYVAIGGHDIQAWNAETASLASTLSNVGTAIVALATSPDGKRLYAVDNVSASSSVLRVVNLDTLAVEATWPLDQPAANPSQPIAVTRPNGVEMVFVDGRAYVAGHSLASAGPTGALSATDDGRRIYSFHGEAFSANNADLQAFALDHSAIAGGVAYVSPVRTFNAFSMYSTGIAVSGDGSLLYVATGYACSRLDPATFGVVSTFPGALLASAGNAALTWDGRIVCGFTQSLDNDLWVGKADGSVLAAWRTDMTPPGQTFTSQFIRTLALTPDGSVAVVPYDNGATFLTFAPLPR